eukprot:TRINITY_DN4090_c0_g2_i4.p1 TRINITY_DN4090_c0_g2~~TRINITY_DN4090_c0_g2_i4.p1  ORF type:complete len:169 (-),score=32.83 TRINITY_DN4090_c0_g2_i4:241-747(-)
MASTSTYRSRVNLRVLAGVAKPNPKMGQSLGPLGINMMQFCKDFNAVTGHIRPDVPLRVVLTAYQDRSFAFKVKSPPTSWFIRRLVGKEKLSPISNYYMRMSVGIKYIYEIAKIKKEMDHDLAHVELQSICKNIIAQCAGMGVFVVDECPPPKFTKIPVKLQEEEYLG